MKHAVRAAFIAMAISGAAQADDPVAQRQTLFEAVEADTDRLEERVDEQDWSRSAALAQQLRQLFPDHSRGGGRSRDAVWDSWADFSARLDKLEAAYRTVALASQAGNRAQTAQALDFATSSCRACHMKYRSLW